MRRAISVGRHTYLRRAGDEDGTEFVRAARRSQALHHPYVHPPTDAGSFAAWRQRGERPDIEQFLICRRSDDALAGFVNLNNIVTGNLQSAALGYAAFLPHDGQGLVSDGVAQALQVAFTMLRLHRLEANIQPGNEPSRALVRRLGFTLEGYSPGYLRVGGEWRDHERWALLEPVWRSRGACSR